MVYPQSQEAGPPAGDVARRRKAGPLLTGELLVVTGARLTNCRKIRSELPDSRNYVLHF